MSFLKFAIQTAEKAGELITKQAEKTFTISLKSKNDLVTSVDKNAEKLIIKEIKKRYPDHAILAEEDSFANAEKNRKKLEESPYIWIIDPIDGTLNFSRKLPFFAVSIALFKNTSIEKSKNYKYFSGELIAGVVHAPKLKETFYAEKGKGAFLNGKKIKTSSTKTVEDAVFATGFPGNFKKDNQPYFNKLLLECRAIRRFGAASLDICYTAAGRFDGYWEFNLKPWDIAAGALILSEAGGLVTDTNNNPLDLFSGEIFCSNKKIHKETIEIFKTICT